MHYHPSKQAYTISMHVLCTSYVCTRSLSVNLVMQIQDIVTCQLSKTIGCICVRVALVHSSSMLCVLPGLLTPQQLAQVSTRVQSWIWYCFMGCFCPCIVLQILALLSALHYARSMVLPS